MNDGKQQTALSGTSVVEVGPGAAAAYCGRLLADAGASVVSFRADGLARDASAAEGAFAAWLAAGKTCRDAATLQQACRQADLVGRQPGHLERSCVDLGDRDVRPLQRRRERSRVRGAYPHAVA